MDIRPIDRGGPWLSHVPGSTGAVVYIQLARSLFHAGGGFFVLENAVSSCLGPGVGQLSVDRTGF